MASPVKPSDIQNSLATIGKSGCEKVAGMFSLFPKLAEFYRHHIGEDGNIAEGWMDELCELLCVTNATPPDISTCAPITLSAVVYERDTKIILKFSGINMVAGLSWQLFKKTNPADPWVLISSGATEGGTLTYEDNGLVNGTTYYYRFSVRNTSIPCPDTYNVDTEGVPTACMELDPKLNLLSPAERTVRIQIGNLPDDFPDDGQFEFYRSEKSGFIGDAISPARLADGNYTWEDTGLDETKRYFYTVYIREKSSCEAIGVSASIVPRSPPMEAPSIAIDGRNLIVRKVNSATGYHVCYLGNTNYHAPVVQYNSRFLLLETIDAAQGDTQYALDLPKNASLFNKPPFDARNYSIAVIAVAADGSASPASNSVLYRTFPGVP